MNADRLLEVYEQISEAPDAIARLRRFVLDLAVRGKLVEQDAGDEPASQLLDRIERRKAEILEETGMRKPRKVPEMNRSEIWAELPLSWAWTQIAELGFISPRNEAPDDAAASFVPMPMIAAEYGAGNEHEPRTWGEIKKGYTHFAEGDVGLAKITPCFENGKSTVFSDLTGSFGSGTTELHVMRPVMVNPDYVVLFLKSPQFIETGIRRMTGTAGQKRVPSEYFTSSPFPLPPLAEQHRIVAKVDELMALCDRLEEARKTREETRDKLTAASLARLTAPDTTPEDFPAHANFAVEALPALTTRPDQIKTLRQTILNLAVRGKLVEQDPADEPASELLERIEQKKLETIQETGMRKPRKVADMDPSETWADLPENWAWTQISKLGFISPRNEADDDAEASFVPMPMIFAEYGVANSHEPRTWGEIKKGYTHFAEGDVGLAKITPCFENGKSTVFRDLTGGFGSGTTELHVLRPVLVKPDYVVLFLKSPQFIEAGIPKMTGTAGQKRVSSEYFTSSPFPLPPLAEQHRILAKVDALMALCDRLEAALSTTDTTRARLLEALLHEALEPSNPKDEIAA